ncbi:hypothetical protein AB0Q97_29270, partial [Streptomyces sp. NPDC088135]
NPAARRGGPSAPRARDKVAVLRLGRNNGFFDVATTSHEEIISAITGATDNAVTRRQARTATKEDAK